MISTIFYRDGRREMRGFNKRAIGEHPDTVLPCEQCEGKKKVCVLCGECRERCKCEHDEDAPLSKIFEDCEACDGTGVA